MAVPSFGANGTTLAGGTRTTSSIAVPASTAAGQVVIATLYIESAAAVTPPAGFTEVNGPNYPPTTVLSGKTATLRQFWKRLAAADSGTYDFTHASAYTRGSAMRWSNVVATGNPIHFFGSAARATADTASPAVSGVTDTVETNLVYAAYVAATGGTWTPPSGMAERLDSVEISINTAGFPGSGNAGSRSAVSTVSGAQGANYFAIRSLAPPDQTVASVGNLGSTLTIGDVTVAPAGAQAATRRNLIPNPSFEVSATDGYTTYGASEIIQRFTDAAVVGAASVRMSTSSATDTCEWARLPTLAAGTYTASVYMRTDSISTNATFVVRRPDNFGTLGTEHHIVGTTAWTRRAITFTAPGGVDIDVLIGMGSYGSTSTGTVWFDGLLLETGSATSPYFDGGYSARGGQTAWSGTPHNSTSTETYSESVSVAVPSLGPSLAFGAMTAAPGSASVPVPSLGPSLAFGTVAATAGPVSVTVSSRASTLTYGSLTASASAVVAPAPLASTLAFGPVVGAPGSVVVEPLSRASTLAFGSVVISASVRVDVPSRPSALTFGPVTTSALASVTPSSVAPSLDFGPIATSASVSAAVPSVGSALAFGPIATSASVSALVDGVPGLLVTFGTVAASATATVAPATLASTLALGLVSASARAVAAPTSLASSLALGPVVASPGPVSAPVPSLGPLARFGPVTAVPIETLATTPSSLASTLAFGPVTLAPGPVTTAAPSRASTLTLGAVTASSTAQIAAPSRPSALAFGPTTATSTAAVTPASLASALALGPVAARPGPVAALVPSRGSTLALGGASLVAGAVAAPVPSRASTLVFGPVTATPGPVSVATPSRVSTLAFGAVATSASALVASTPLASTLVFGPVSISASTRVEVPPLQAPVAAFTITLSPGEVVVAVESLLSALAFGGIASTQRRNLDVRVGRPHLSPWLTARPPVTTGRPHGALVTTRPTT